MRITYSFAINTDDPEYTQEKPYFTEPEMQEMRQSIVTKYRKNAIRMLYGEYVKKAAKIANAKIPLYQECFIPEPEFPYIYRITCYAD